MSIQKMNRMKPRRSQYKVKGSRGKKTKFVRTLTTRQPFTNNSTAQLVSFPGYGFPDTCDATLSYCDTYLLQTTVAITAPYKTYSLNNIYDPDQATGGHQPMFFDQLSAVYGRYVVLGAKIVAEFTADQAIANGPWAVGIESTANNTLVSTNENTLMESPDTQCDIIGGDHGKVRISATYSPSKLGTTWVDDQVGALVSTYPSRQWYAHTWAIVNGPVTNTNVNVSIRIEYRVRFSKRADISGS